MAKFSEIATVRSEMTVGAREALDNLDASLMQMFEVKCDSLPEDMRGAKKFTSFESLMRKLNKAEKDRPDPRTVSVKFNRDRAITESTPERLAKLEEYREKAETGEAIEYTTIEDRGQYEAHVKFACQLAEWGWFSEEDFPNGEED